MSEKKEIRLNTLYPIISQLIVHSESITWNRLYNFLIAASILILSWSTLYVKDESKLRWLLFGISLIGSILSFAWIWMGIRGRKYLGLHWNIAHEIEKEIPYPYRFFTKEKALSAGNVVYETWLYRYYGKIKDKEKVNEKKHWRYKLFWPIRVFSSRGLMWIVPILFFSLFVFLIFVSFSILCN